MKKYNVKRWFKALFTVVVFAFLCNCLTNLVYADSEVKVSIIVPVYKVEEWINECMDSLVNQTLKQIEIICIDDGSPDNCGKILDDYAKADERVIVVHQENQGLSCARNVGIDLAKGEYLAFVDSDDYVRLDTYERVYNIAHDNQDDVLEFGVTTVPSDSKIKLITYDRKIDIKDPRQLKKIISNYYVWNKIYKTSMIQENNVKFIPKMLYEDNAFTLMMMPYMKKYQSLEEKFYYYRQRNGSVTNIGIKHKDLPNCINAIFSVCQEWRNQDVLKGNEDYILSILLEKYYWALNPSIQQNPLMARQILDSFGDDIYNADVLKRCNFKTKRVINALENFCRKS